MTTTLLESLARGEGVWLRGAPGSGRSHALRGLVRSWDGPVVHLRGASVHEDLVALPSLGKSVLRVVDDVPDGLDRELFGEGPVLVAGGRAGHGWQLEDLPALSTDEGVALFMRHAPGAGPADAVRRLVRTLGSHPTAIIAAARRWPLERLEAVLLEATPEWPGLRQAWEALSEEARQSLGVMCGVGGVALRGGLVQSGVEGGVPELVASGWAQVREPGVYRVQPAIVRVVSGWSPSDVEGYRAWLMAETESRLQVWDRTGGPRSWFSHADWAELHRGGWAEHVWFFQAWSLSSQDPEALLVALDAAGLDPVADARCRARALHALGRQGEAIEVLEAVREAPPGASRAFALVELGVAHHRLRRLEEARAAYEEAAEVLESLGLARGHMLCVANLAALDHDRGELEAAARGYETAHRIAASLGERRLRGIFGGNLGALRVEQERLGQAREVLSEAARDLALEGDDRFLAIVTVNLAAVELLEWHLDAAERRYVTALHLFGESDPSSTALCHARRGAVAALAGDLGAAADHHAAADAAVSPVGDPHTAAVIALWRAPMEWLAGDRLSALGRRREALAGDRPLVSVSDEARLVLRLIELLSEDATQLLTIGPGGRWFRLPGEEVVDVSRYAAPSAILAHLGALAERSPGVASDADALIQAGWPGERIVPDAARNRMSVALAQLRKLGLKGVIQKTSEGWRLDPSWPTLLLQEPVA